MPAPVKSSQSRLFTIEDRAGPANVPEYQGRARAQGPSWSLGDRTPVREPDPTRYGAFRIVDAIKSEAGLVTLSVEARYGFTVSEFLRMARRGCPLDLQVHFGQCQDPRDFNLGWNKVFVLEDADIANWSTGDMGALEQGEEAVVNESIDFNALDAYEIKQILFAELGEAEILGEVMAVVICDAISCGECGIPSTGCQTFFAITELFTASPGLPAEVVYSDDGGTTLGETNVGTLGANEDPSDMACVGTRLAVISNDAGAAGTNALNYAPIIDILNGVEVWTGVAGGFVPAGAPNAITSLDSAHTWIVGDAGYVYFTDDITADPVVQDAGIAAGGDDLQDVHALDEDHVLAVGNNDAVVYTEDGQTWAGIDGPTALAPAALLCCWMRTELEWFVGDANGQLWYTRDRGVNWVEKVFPGSGAGNVRDIVFATPTVGYMSHDTAVPAGRILRTIDGGFSWYVLPEGPTVIPGNLQINSLAAVSECPNVVYAGGLEVAGLGGDGILIKGA